MSGSSVIRIQTGEVICFDDPMLSILCVSRLGLLLEASENVHRENRGTECALHERLSSSGKYKSKAKLLRLQVVKLVSLGSQIVTIIVIYLPFSGVFVCWCAVTLVALSEEDIQVRRAVGRPA